MRLRNQQSPDTERQIIINNFETEFFTITADFDACVINADEPLPANVKPENLASTIVYVTDASQFYGTFAAGKLIQKDERYERTKKEFNECVKQFR